VKNIRKDLLIICLIMLLIDIGIIFVYTNLTGNKEIIQQIVRFILTLILIIFVIRDAKWAKWILSILSILAGILGLVFSIMFISKGNIAGIILLLMGIYYTFAGIYIIATRNKNKIEI